MSTIGVIAIGRNEGERLRRCLTSVVGRGMQVVYVDSGSTDGSVDLAGAMGAAVVELDLSIPFSAARARNEGFSRLMQLAPQAKFAQFVDGDCEIVEGWIGKAVRELELKPEAAAVCGRRRERHPEHSVYNRIADLEWNTPIGEAQSVGGDALFRVAAFQQVDGFDASVVAGEEPELCQRLREAGWKLYRIDAEMTLHDAATSYFRQWWKRSVRSGYGATDVATRFARGNNGLFVKQTRSTQVWVLFPVVVLLVFAFVWVPARAVKDAQTAWLAATIATLLVAFIWPMQVLKIALGQRRKRQAPWGDALAYGLLTMIGKFAFFRGASQYHRDRRAGKITRSIDYKATPQKTTIQGAGS